MLTDGLSMAQGSPLRPVRSRRRSRLFTCQEWCELPVGGDGCLTEAEADRLYICAQRAEKRLKLPKGDHVLVRTSSGLKAGQVVGVLAVPGCSLEILPKIDGRDGAVRKALIRMLAVVRKLHIADGELAALDMQHHDLLEQLIGLFSDRLLTKVRRDLPRRYVAHEEDLRLLRGRLDVKRQTTHLAVRPDRLACRFDELSENTPLNRVFKATVKRLADIARSPANAQLLAELAARLETVAASHNPLGEPVRLDRTNTAFHDLYRLAQLFLQGHWQSTTGGWGEGFSLLFPMNDLFEEFIGRSLRRALGAGRVELQSRTHYAIEGKLFQLRPDVVIDAPDNTIVLDTKWKELDPDDEKRGVKQDDIYQLIAYAQAWKAKRVILLYPWRTGLHEGIERHWQVAGGGCPFDIATVNVGRPDGVVDALRDIVDSNSQARAPAG